MKYRNLGHTDTQVSQLCLGSMTWGTQNGPEEAFAQIDLALEHGINFIDTAEMYPATPLGPETQGRTEDIIGQWIDSRKRRSDVVVATKVTGKGTEWIADGQPISDKRIRQAVEGSLRRLKTDYIDLYQLHWPNRGSYHFRQWSSYDPTQQNRQQTRSEIHEILTTLDELIKEGKIRHVGLSNESCWGTAQFLQIAEEHNLPRMVTTQNEYNLMCRLFDLDFAELAHNENFGLLAFSPLAAGMLSGKYETGIPAGSRRSLNPDLSGRYNDYSQPVLDQYLAVAKEHGLSPAQMAIAFCMTRPFMASVIFGATSMEQLKNNLGAANLKLDETVMSGIAEIHRDYPVPM